MRRHLMKIYDVVVFGSFAIFLACLASTIPDDARTRLLRRVVELVRTSGGF